MASWRFDFTLINESIYFYLNKFYNLEFGRFYSILEWQNFGLAREISGHLPIFKKEAVRE